LRSITITLMPVFASDVSTWGMASYILTRVMLFCLSSSTTDAGSGRSFATLP